MTGSGPSWSTQAARWVSRGCTRSQAAVTAVPYREVTVLVVTGGSRPRRRLSERQLPAVLPGPPVPGWRGGAGSCITRSSAAWTPIRYPRARSGMQPAALLGLRRPGRRNPLHRLHLEEEQGHHRPADRSAGSDDLTNRKAAAGQDELFPLWRYHAVFTDTPFVMLQAEGDHRDHAVVEQVFADWTDGPLAHLPSGSFPANAAWLALAAISHNLLRAAGALASLAFARARGATLRRDLIDVAARTARHGRGHLTLHLPGGWHREIEWMNIFEAACGPPTAAA